MHFPHESYMKAALGLARRGLGRVAPNPAVGCIVLDSKGRVAGRGWTADGGRPHAETQALAQAGKLARGGTAYVTLEPCSHFGNTPPCAQALIAAGVRRVVIGCGDPDPRVSGAGIAALEAAGIEVIAGVREAECRALNAGFFLRVTRNRPYVTLKCAISADGKIAAAQGQRTQISGERGQAWMHSVRARHDAILIGIETALADDPLLTTRLAGVEHKGLRIVLDSALRLPPGGRLARDTQGQGVLIICRPEGKESAQAKLLEDMGAELLAMDPRDLQGVLAALSARGITRLQVEGGAAVHAAFLKAGLCDEFALLRSTVVLGAQGVDAAFGGADPAVFLENQGLVLRESRDLGQDVLEIYGRPA